MVNTFIQIHPHFVHYSAIKLMQMIVELFQKYWLLQQFV